MLSIRPKYIMLITSLVALVAILYQAFLYIYPQGRIHYSTYVPGSGYTATDGRIILKGASTTIGQTEIHWPIPAETWVASTVKPASGSDIIMSQWAAGDFRYGCEDRGMPQPCRVLTTPGG